MSMLDIAQRVSEAKEPEVVPEGMEYELECIKMRQGTHEATGLEYIIYTFKILNPPEEIVNPRFVEQFMWISSTEDIKEAYDAQRANDNDLNMRYLFEGLGVDISQPFHMEDDVVGQTGWAILGIRDEGEYGLKNNIKKWVAPK